MIDYITLMTGSYIIIIGRLEVENQNVSKFKCTTNL